MKIGFIGQGCEKAWDAFARGCRYFDEGKISYKVNAEGREGTLGYNLNSACKASAYIDTNPLIKIAI